MNLENIYKNLSKQKFIFTAIFICLSADILFFIFVKQHLLTTKSIIDLASSKNPLFASQSTLEQEQWANFLISQVSMIVGAYFLLNSIVYIFFYKEKRWAINYVQNGAALIGILFSVLTIIEVYQVSIAWTFIMISLVPLYIYAWQGCKYFFKRSNNEDQTA